MAKDYYLIASKVIAGLEEENPNYDMILADAIRGRRELLFARDAVLKQLSALHYRLNDEIVQDTFNRLTCEFALDAARYFESGAEQLFLPERPSKMSSLIDRVRYAKAYQMDANPMIDSKMVISRAKRILRELETQWKDVASSYCAYRKPNPAGT